MRPRIVAASTATLIAAASLSPLAAEAAGQNTIFVDRSSAACTDSGTGTSAAPFCTLQAAADAAAPGDVVNVAAGTYPATTITRSGTASAPITFTGNGIWNRLGLTGGAAGSFDVSGASNIVIQNFSLNPGSTADAVVEGGSGIDFNTDVFRDSTAAEPALHVTGNSSAVTVQDSLVQSQVLVDGGSTGTVVTTNRLYPGFTNPISVMGAADTAITSNTIYGCGPGVSVTGSAAGTAIENNVIEERQSTAAGGACPAPRRPTTSSWTRPPRPPRPRTTTTSTPSVRLTRTTTGPAPHTPRRRISTRRRGRPGTMTTRWPAPSRRRARR